MITKDYDDKSLSYYFSRYIFRLYFIYIYSNLCQLIYMLLHFLLALFCLFRNTFYVLFHVLRTSID